VESGDQFVKAVWWVGGNHRPAGREIGEAEQIDQLVGAVSDQDLPGVDAQVGTKPPS
jgi:hypothetical protein